MLCTRRDRSHNPSPTNKLALITMGLESKLVRKSYYYHMFGVFQLTALHGHRSNVSRLQRFMHQEIHSLLMYIYLTLI